MNGKMAKMMKKFRRSDHKSKRLLMSLPRNVRGKIRTMHRENGKLIDIDFLREVTGE